MKSLLFTSVGFFCCVTDSERRVANSSEKVKDSEQNQSDSLLKPMDKTINLTDSAYRLEFRYNNFRKEVRR